MTSSKEVFKAILDRITAARKAGDTEGIEAAEYELMMLLRRPIEGLPADFKIAQLPREDR